MPAASDVPGRFDLVIDVGGTKTGYLFNEAIETYTTKNLATYGYSPTFVERQNVQGSYGDDSQAFWLTASQNDWSLGEDQKFFRANDEDSRRRFYQGSNVDIRREGQVSMRDAIKTLTAASAPQVAVATNAGIYFASATNLYLINSTGTITDKGAHGLGVAPSNPNGIATDGTNVFLSSTAGGTVGVRRYDGAAFSTFSATASKSLAFLNNTLYGYNDNSVLRRYDTAGVATTLFTFTTATGGSPGGTNGDRILPYGGKLLIFRGWGGNTTSEARAELWIWDGVGVSLLHAFEPNFYANAVAVSQGIIFVLGSLNGPASNQIWSAVFYYANGTPGLLWKSPRTGSQQGTLGTFDGGIVWANDATSQYTYYNIATGGVHRLGTVGASSATAAVVSSTYNFIGFSATSTSIDFWPDSVKPTSSTVATSLFDFDSSLNKLFRGVKVDFDSATDGNGGTVDIAYQVGDVGSSGFTTLQTGAVSGTEYTLSSVTGRSVSAKVTLNKGTSTDGPVLKRIYVRAVPILQQYPFRKYDVSCVGNIDQRQVLRDGTLNPKTGRELADALITAITSTTPVTIYDRFTPAGYTAVLEPSQCEINEIHAVSEAGSKSGEFRATIVARGV